MRLSVITDEISMDLAHAVDVMKEYGCAAAELRTVWDTNIADMSDEQVDKARKTLDEKQMPVCCLSTPLYKCDLPGQVGGAAGMTHQASGRAPEQQMEVLERCTKLARLFGTKYIRIFSYWKHGDLTCQIEDAIAEGISDGVKYAEDSDVVLLMENEHACYLGTGRDTARMLARFNSPALRAVWDPGNAFMAGEKAFPDGYETIRNYVDHVHVKDAELLASGKRRFILVGEGEIGYKEQFEALRSDGYNGCISLETHYAPFAGTKEQSSRLCLQALNVLLALDGGSSS
ncbi:MAG: hypothetical protein A2Z18_10855 [Armatimonadetes bacterium RBG_16_58_9]|nr:MAG: hypothetical protein A2Z18_10855 [Armatimonadetes bacterium RBG_16_58_9]